MQKYRSLKLKPKKKYNPHRTQKSRSKKTPKQNTKPKYKMWQYGGDDEIKYYLLMSSEDLKDDNSNDILNKLSYTEEDKKDKKATIVGAKINIDELNYFKDDSDLTIDKIKQNDEDSVVYLGKVGDRIFAVMKVDGEEVKIELNDKYHELKTKYNNIMKAEPTGEPTAEPTEETHTTEETPGKTPGETTGETPADPTGE